MSLTEFAAAISPNVRGSSTIGVKKSTVCTSAVFSSSRYTPASSLVSNPTSTLGSVCRGNCRKTESSVPGLSFAAQPAALAIVVNLTRSVMEPPSCSSKSLQALQHYKEDTKSLPVAELHKLRLDLPACLHLRMPWDFWLIFLFLGVILPWRGLQRVLRLIAIPEVTSAHRIRLYVWTILFQWALAVIIAWRALARGLTWRDLGLATGFSASILFITALGATLIAIVHWVNLRRLSETDHPAIESLRALGSRL